MHRQASIRTCLAAAVAATLLAPGIANAQYKWLAADGTMNYSDKPPPHDARVVGSAPLATSRDDDADAALPFALRDVARRHPVVLYTTDDCPPCTQARAQLTKRGIPFIEKTVRTPNDADAFQSLGFPERGFPALAIGRERSNGWEPGALDRSLDAAGYPKTTMLPPSYRLVPPASLAQPMEKVGPRIVATDSERAPVATRTPRAGTVASPSSAGTASTIRF